MLYLSASTGVSALSVALVAMSINEWIKGTISNVEVMSITFFVLVSCVSMQIYFLLVKLKTTVSQLKQTSAHSADKLSHSEIRLMNFTITCHEAERQVVQTFFDWDIEVDKVFFYRKVTQWSEVWSAAQQRVGFPSGLHEWQWGLQSAMAKIKHDISEIKDEKHQEYYNKILELWETQRTGHETTAAPEMSHQELRSASKEKIKGLGCLMPSLDF